MPTLVKQSIENIDITKLAGSALKMRVMKMLSDSSQCQAIFECVNEDSGEYRIVLHGMLDTTSEKQS